MIIRVIVVAAVLLAAAQAEEHFYQKGTLAEMKSVACGYEEKGGKGFVGSLIGTDSEHRKTRDTLCQEYVLETDRVTYRIRPRDEKHPVLLPISESAEFRIRKDKLLLRVRELDNKEREYVVLSMMPRPAAKAEGSARAEKAMETKAADSKAQSARSTPPPQK